MKRCSDRNRTATSKKANVVLLGRSKTTLKLPRATADCNNLHRQSRLIWRPPTWLYGWRIHNAGKVVLNQATRTNADAAELREPERQVGEGAWLAPGWKQPLYWLNGEYRPQPRTESAKGGKRHYWGAAFYSLRFIRLKRSRRDGFRGF